MGKVITFYSYKGGTGRSMMLANIAWLLATNGERVLVIDWDLEAPGLHRYFKPFLVDPDMIETDGLIDAFWALASRALTNESPSGKLPPFDDQNRTIQVDFEDYISPLKWTFHGKGGIDFVGAGRQGATYSERVNTFDWKRFYQLGGGRLLDRTKDSLINQYEFVLIDSRTGVSDTSGICTMQMPDVLVACLTLNRQSIEGVASILDSIRTWRSDVERRSQRGESRREIEFYPVATRIENSEKEKLDLARARVREVFRPFLSQSESRDARQYWDDMEVTYRPFYAYEEILAAFGDASGAAGSAKTLLSEMEVIGRRVCDRPDLATPEILESDRQIILAQYALGVPTPTQQGAKSKARTKAVSQPDTVFLRNIFAKEVLWRQSGFRYRHLLSRRELQLVTPEEKGDFGRQMSFFHTNSETFAAFRELTNRIFVVMYLGLFLFPFLAINPWERLFLRDISQSLYFNQVVWPFMTTAYISFVVFQFFAAFRSPKKPYGLRLSDVVRLSLLGPFAPEIEDFREENERPQTQG